MRPLPLTVPYKMPQYTIDSCAYGNVDVGIHYIALVTLALRCYFKWACGMVRSDAPLWCQILQHHESAVCVIS